MDVEGVRITHTGTRRMIATPTGSRPPYPGLRPFRRNESHLFFGRDDCTNGMVSRLAATHFLAVLGSSGSGKSSLVNTGLLDSLELGFMAQAGSRWRIASFRPGGAPLRNLARALLATENGTSKQAGPSLDIDVNRLRSKLKNEPSSVSAWCDEGHLPKGTSLLVLVDQFEELFRYQNYAERDEAEAFRCTADRDQKSERLRKSARKGVSDLCDDYHEIGISRRRSLLPGLAEAINEGAFLPPE